MELKASPRDGSFVATSAVLGSYVLVRKLGQGACSEVFLAIESLSMIKEYNNGKHHFYAIKCTIMNQSTDIDYNTYVLEAAITRKVAHPNVIAVCDEFYHSNIHCIVLEHAKGGDLLTCLNQRGSFSDSQARNYFIQIAKALQHAHSVGIVHHDVKLENILLDETQQHIYLADWGFACGWRPDTKQIAARGSLFYASPELINQFPYYGPEVDVWALGVVLYAMVNGVLPFAGSDSLVRAQISAGKYMRIKGIDPDCFLLISQLLCVNPAKRLTIQQALQHVWITKPTVVIGKQRSNSSCDCSIIQ